MSTPRSLGSVRWLRSVGRLRAVGLFAALGLALGSGCSSSHTVLPDGGGGTACGPTTCAPGLVCCNESCGICTEPGGSCIALFCEDAGPPSVCGLDTCGADETCCTGCPGDPDFCVSGSECPVFDCPPPPPGCESCGIGAICCPGCPGEGSFCAGGPVCPDLACPPPRGCEAMLCAPGSECCAGCPGDEAYCSEPGVACPDILCPEPIPCGDLWACEEGAYCARDTCGGDGFCRPLPTACPEDCPGVCGCDGETYCNRCDAASHGTTVAHEGECVPSACGDRDYCDCSGDCAPLIDLTPGCVCPCDEPFNCTGELCACACGGAEYLGCAVFGQCAETEVRCDAGCTAILDAAGCPTCACAAPGG